MSTPWTFIPAATMSVRYKAVGVNFHFGDPVKFEFVLDTSKGYSLELSDPALFDLRGLSATS